MKRMLCVLPAVVLLVTFAAPARAGEGKQALRYQVSYFAPSGDFKTTTTLGEYKYKFEGTLGAGLGYEYRFTDLVGLDVALRLYKPEVKFTSPSGYIKKRVRVLPLTVGAMFHFAKTETMNFYAGPELAYVDYGSIEFSPAPGNTVGFKNELTWGVKAGVDVPFNDAWAFTAALEYLGAKSKTKFPAPWETGDVDTNAKPIIVTIGAAWRF